MIPKLVINSNMLDGWLAGNPEPSPRKIMDIIVISLPLISPTLFMTLLLQANNICKKTAGCPVRPVRNSVVHQPTNILNIHQGTA